MYAYMRICSLMFLYLYRFETIAPIHFPEFIPLAVIIDIILPYCGPYATIQSTYILLGVPKSRFYPGIPHDFPPMKPDAFTVIPLKPNGYHPGIVFPTKVECTLPIDQQHHRHQKANGMLHPCQLIPVPVAGGHEWKYNNANSQVVWRLTHSLSPNQYHTPWLAVTDPAAPPVPRSYPKFFQLTPGASHIRHHIGYDGYKTEFDEKKGTIEFINYETATYIDEDGATQPLHQPYSHDYYIVDSCVITLQRYELPAHQYVCAVRTIHDGLQDASLVSINIPLDPYFMNAIPFPASSQPFLAPLPH